MANYGYTFTSGDTVTPTKLNNARTVSEIVNADIASAAAIVGTKVSPNFGSQAVSTTGTATLGTLSVTGNTTLGDATADTITLTGTVQPGVVVSGSSAGDAVRITQTGAGNALTIEDSANPDSTPVIVDAAGNAVIGHTAALAAGGTTQPLTVSGLGATLVRAAADAVGAVLMFCKSRSTTVGGARAIVANNDELGAIEFAADNGANLSVLGAIIQASVDGTPGSADMPARLVFSTTADGAASPTERMRITNAGNVGIANTSPSEKLHVTGNIKASGFIDTDTSFRGQASDSAGAPSFTWTGDTNTGMFRPAEDTLAFSEGGSEVMRIDSSGNVGIGTAAPSTKLDVSGTVTATAFSGPLTGSATTLATGRTIELTGDVTGTTGSFNGSANVSAATTIANNAVDNTKLRDSAALSVIGRSANSSGDPADIAAATDGHVLRRSGTALGFGQIATGGITDAAVTTAKIADANVTTAKIADANVTTAKIADANVTTAKILDANVTPAKLSQPLTLATAQATTSGTSIDFTGIPSWVKRITVMFGGVSTSGTSIPMIQLGDSGGIEATGYAGSAGFVTGASSNAATYTDGFRLNQAHAASTVFHGNAVLALLSGASNTWAMSFVGGYSNSGALKISGGSKSLSDALTQVRLTTVNGTDTFDAGSVNIMYEG